MFNRTLESARRYNPALGPYVRERVIAELAITKLVASGKTVTATSLQAMLKQLQPGLPRFNAHKVVRIALHIQPTNEDLHL